MRTTRKSYTESTLYDYAVGALARKMRTVAELKRLLRNKAITTENSNVMIEAVIRKLKDQKYLNDSQYADVYSRNRKENEKFGKRRVITDLKTKGVHGDVIEAAVASAYDDSNEEQLARQFVERKRLKKPATQKDAARVFRMLLRAGFSAGTIYKVLKKWNVEDELLNVLEGETTENSNDLSS
jgi:regulatory protein